MKTKEELAELKKEFETSTNKLKGLSEDELDLVAGGGNNDAPGASAPIRTRGAGTINGSNDPLYIIDGVPVGSPLNQINPDEIESIEVLKDASSTAIYGSKGKNE